MLTVKTIQLKNFKKHKDLSIDFSLKTNLIVGDNYAGKSTVLQAIAVALFGNSLCPGTLTDFVHDGCNTFCLTLTLSDGTVVTRSPKNSVVESPEGEVVCRSHSAVNDYMADLLNIDKKTFIKVFLSEQGSPQALLSMAGIEMQRFIESCLGLEKLDEVASLCKKKITVHSSSVDLLSEQMLPEKEYLQFVAVEKVCQQNRVSLQKEKQTCEEALQKTRNLLKTLKVRYRSEEEAHLAYDNFSTRKAILLEQLNKLPEKQKEKDTPILVAEIRQLENTLNNNKKAHEEYNTATADVAKNRVLCEDVEKQIKGSGPVLKEPEGLKGAQGFLSLAEARLSVLQTEVSSLSRTLLAGKCSQCKSMLTDPISFSQIQKDLSEAKAGLLESEQLVQEGQVKLATLVKEGSLFKKQDESLSLLRQHLNIYVDQLKQSLQVLAGISQPAPYSAESALVEIESHQNNLSAILRDNAGITANNILLESLKGAIAELTEVVKPLSLLPDLSAELDDVQTSVDEARESVYENTTASSANTVKLTRTLELINDYQKSLEIFTHEASALSLHREIYETLQQVRKSAIDQALSTILSVASAFVAAATGGYISSVSLSDNFITYQEEDICRVITAASGAQKSLIGVGLKLGVAQVVRSNFSCMLFDEISADMDESISLSCLSLLNNYCQQAIVVSHRSYDVAESTIRL